MNDEILLPLSEVIDPPSLCNDFYRKSLSAKMNKDEIPQYHQLYHELCSCGKMLHVSTQRDNGPEYYTNVFVHCDCGDGANFELPVN